MTGLISTSVIDQNDLQRNLGCSKTINHRVDCGRFIVNWHDHRQHETRWQRIKWRRIAQLLANFVRHFCSRKISTQFATNHSFQFVVVVVASSVARRLECSEKSLLDLNRYFIDFRNRRQAKGKTIVSLLLTIVQCHAKFLPGQLTK